MLMKNVILAVLFALSLTSCGAMLQGMAMGMQQMGGYGGYGYGTGYVSAPSYSAPVYSAPAYSGSVVPGFGSNIDYSSMGSGSYSGSSSGSYSPSSGSGSSSSGGSSFCRQCSNTKTCPTCHGSGKRTDNMFGTGSDSKVKCSICSGSGRCPYCK